MGNRFGSNFLVHLLGPGGAVFFAYLAYRSSVDHFVMGGLGLRIGLVTACVAMAGLVLWLYLRSGIQRYEVTGSGLLIHRPWGNVTVPWTEFRRIDWITPLHCVVFRGQDGVIVFCSTDLFPRMEEFLRAVHRHSGCALSEHLRRELYDGGHL